MEKRGNRLKILLYFALVLILLLFLFLHSFRIVELNTDFFTRFLIALLFVLLLLPAIPKIKIFDVVEIKREGKMFKVSRKK